MGGMAGGGGGRRRWDRDENGEEGSEEGKGGETSETEGRRTRGSGRNLFIDREGSTNADERALEKTGVKGKAGCCERRKKRKKKPMEFCDSIGPRRLARLRKEQLFPWCIFWGCLPGRRRFSERVSAWRCEQSHVRHTAKASRAVERAASNRRSQTRPHDTTT